ncbi:hypothetical protein TrVFT333_009458 [Trichoderma virens FT-333]|nr:hypothetical protein TrVFT333_009458 [Trichoderma virens FT-333]
MTMLITEAVPILSNDLDSTRLEVSPYAAPSVALQLKDASRLYVPAHLLWGFPSYPLLVKMVYTISIYLMTWPIYSSITSSPTPISPLNRKARR